MFNKALVFLFSQNLSSSPGEIAKKIFPLQSRLGDLLGAVHLSLKSRHSTENTFRMDEAVLQRISTSMSVDNFHWANRKPEVAAEPVGGDNVELLLEIVDDLQERVDNGHDSGELEDHPSDVEELLEILINYDFQVSKNSK
jgi:hypothetical protein